MHSRAEHGNEENRSLSLGFHGPYYQWTFKRAAKTVTVNLTASQARIYQRAIDAHRKLEQITDEMRELSLKILEAKTEGVKKRKYL
jgi:hypothetical protein